MDLAVHLDLAAALEGGIGPLGFQRVDGEVVGGDCPVTAAWVRKTWNTNRGVVLLRVGEDARPIAALAERAKLSLGGSLRYFPFFYGIGLQLVYVGHDLEAQVAGLKAGVDKIDNQRAIVQSLHVVDLSRSCRWSERTWGQEVMSP